MNDEDLRLDLLPLYEGGVNVGPTRYLIRATHVPTGLSVTANDNRGHHRGKECALTMLKMLVEELA